MKPAMHSTLLVLALCCLTGVASAGDTGPEPARRVVNFADIDVTRSAGVTVLYARLLHAARLVCEPVNDRALSSIALTRRCMEQAVERAVADVNAPALTNYHLTKTGQIVTVAQLR